MPKSKEDALNQKSGIGSSNMHVSRLKSRSIVRSNSSASLRESQTLNNLKRSGSVKKLDELDETKTFSPEGECMFNDGLLALYQETMEGNKGSNILQGQDEIMSQLLYLENKAVEKKQLLIKSAKKFACVKNSVFIKENCDRLVPEYDEITCKLEAMSVSTNLSELFFTLDLMLSQVQAINLESLNVDDVKSYTELCDTMERDLTYLKQLRDNQMEPLLEQAIAAFETLNKKFERLELIKTEVEKMSQLIRIRNIEDSCVQGG